MRRQEAIGGEDAAGSGFSPGNEVLGCLEDAHTHHECFSNQEQNIPQQHSGGGKMDPASPNVLDGQVRRSDRR